MNTPSNSSFMPEADLAYTILSDLKRTVREYTTATTESNCPVVRQMFTSLTNNTLKLQGDLYSVMQQNNMYPPPGKALKMDIDKQIQMANQTKQKCEQFLQQKNIHSASNSPIGQPYGTPTSAYDQQHQHGNPYYS
ncbi:spore coat protein [Paenibacillus sp. Marseille-Q4541]|uniref:spore coat protein n=1 Tax=Paenibacillus sp. Marseille-Q4541 TaxID=2831522 RepID=UPI001BAD1E2D|nr:spore coat protein [Paenibacillus sp. Marseille-Q4541]